MKKKKNEENPQEYIQLLEQKIEELTSKNELLEKENFSYKNLKIKYDETQQQLEIVETRYQSFFENTGTAMAVFGSDSLINSCNTRFVELCECGKDEIMGILHWYDFVHEQDKARMMEYHQQREKNDTNAPAQYHFRFITKKGNTHEIFLNIVVLQETGERLASLTDVTELVQLQKELKKQLHFTETLINTVPVPVFYKDIHGKYLGCNRAFEEMMGVSSSEIIGKTVYDLTPSDIAYLYAQKDNELFLNPGFQHYEWILRNKKGEIREVVYHKASFFDANNENAGLIGTVLDVTERNKNIEQLKQSEERFHLFYEQSPIAYQSLDFEGCFLDINEVWLQTLGYQREEVIGKWFGDFLHVRYKTLFKERFEQFKKAGEVNAVDFELLKKDGTYVFVVFSGKISYDVNGEMIRSHCVFYDLSERHKAELLLQESEQQLQTIFDATPSVMCLLNEKLEIIKINKTGLQFAKGNLEEILYKQGGDVFGCIYALKNPEGCGKGDECKSCAVRNTVLKAVQEQKNIARAETSMWVTGEDGQRQQYYFLQSVNILNFSDWKGILVTLDNITERKLIEMALQHSEQRYQKITEAITDYIYTVKIENNIAVATTHSITCYGVTGYSKQEFENNTFLWYQIIFDDDKVLVEKQIQQLFAYKTAVSIEHRIYKKNGELRWIANTVIPNIDKNGFLISYDGIIRDITERKIAELQVLDAHQYVESIFKAAPIAIGVVKNRIFDKVNQYMITLLGYTAEELCGKSASMVYPTEEEYQWVGEQKYRQITEKGTGTVETRWKCKDGTIIDIILSSTPIDVDDWNKGVTFTAIDITERKRAEHALRKSEEKYRNIIETMNEGLLMVDNEDVILFANNRLCQIFGFSPNELIGKKGLETIIYHEDRAIIYEKNQLRTHHVSDTYQIRGVTKSGNLIWLSISGSPVADDFGHVIGSVGLITDITESKQAEVALQKSEQRYRTIVDTANEGIWTMDENFITSYVNSKMAAMLGYEANEMLGKSISDFMIKAELQDNTQKMQNRAKGLSEIYERSFIRKDGTICNFIVSANSLRDEDGTFRGSFAMLTDISDLRRIEQELLEKNQQMEAFFNYSVDMLCIANTEGYFIRLNPEWENTLGYALTELEGQKFFDFIHPDDLQATIEAMNKLENEKLLLNFVNRYRCKDGTYRWIEWRSLLIEKTVYAAARDITEQRDLQIALMESESKIKNKLQALLSPEGDIGTLELSDILDINTLQNIMDNFYALTKVGIGIIDLNGKVLVATGWQDLCTKFHRVHPDTCRNCIETDLFLSTGVSEGTYKIYKCKNNIWDIAMPLIIGGKHVANIFLGQFLFDDEQIDLELFKAQAKKYGFDEMQYIDALNKIPRWSKEKVDSAMQFYAKFANVISSLSFSNLKLARIVEQLTQTQAALAESEKLNRELIANMTDGVYQSTPDGRFLMVNEAMVRIFGYDSIEEMLAMDIANQLYPSPEQRTNTYPPSLKDEMKIIQLKKKDGTLILVEENGWYITDENGKVIRHEGVLRDVTEKLKIQEALRTSEENLAITLQSIGDGVIATDKSGYIVNMNHVAEMLCGWTLQEAKGKLLNEVFYIVNAKTLDKVENPVNKVIETGKIVGLANHTMLISKNGQQYQIADSASPIRNRDGEIIGVVLVFSDVTEEYALAEKLRISEERLDLAMAVKNEGVWDWNLINNEAFFDERYYTMAGYEPNEFPQNFDAWAAHVHPEDLENAKKEIEDYLSGKINIYDIEFRFKHKNNSWIWIQGRGKIVAWDENKKPSRIIGTHTDITLQKLSQLALQESEEVFRKLYEDSYDPILLMKDNTFVNCNNATVQILGAENKEQILGVTPMEISPEYQPDGRTSIEAAHYFINNALQNGYARFEWLCKKFDDAPIYFEITLMPIILRGENLLHITWRDITERKAAELKLRNSEERFRSLVNSLSDVIYTLDLEQRYTGVYGGWVEKAGLTPEFFLGKSAVDIYGQQMAAIHEQANLRALNGEVVTYEWDIANEQGTHYYQTIVAPMYDADGNIYGIVGAGRNITDRVNAESELKLKSFMLDQISDMVTITDLQGKITYVNQAELNISGLRKEELIGKSVAMYGEDASRGATQKEIIENTLKNGAWRGEVVNYFPDGRECILDCRTTVIVDEKNNPLALCGITTDITRNKQAELEIIKAKEKAELSEYKIRSMFNNSLTGFIYFDTKGNILDANKAFLDIFGSPSLEASQQHVNLLTFKNLVDIGFSGDILKSIEQKQSVTNISKYTSRWNRQCYIQYQIIPIVINEEIVGLWANITDLTEIYLLQEMVKTEKNRLQGILEGTNAGTWEWNIQTGETIFNERWAEIIGYTLNEISPVSIDTWAKYCHPDDFKISNALMEKHLKGESDYYSCELRMAHKNGSWVWVLDHGKVVSYTTDGKPLLMMGTHLDITERKQAEEKLRTEQEQLLSIFNSMDAVIYITDPITHEIIYVNKFFQNQLSSDYMNKKCYKAFHGLDAPCPFCTNDIILQQKPEPYSWKFHNTNLDRYYDIVDRIIRWPDGRDVRFEMAIDITERELAENKLRESEEKFRQIAENISEVFWLRNADNTKMLYINPAYEKIWGRSCESVLNDANSFIEAVYDLDKPAVFAEYSKYMAGGTFNMEYRIVRPDGGIRWVQVQSFPVRNEAGEIIRHTGIATDITERKLAEQALRESEERFKSLHNASFGGIAIHDKGIILECNQGLSDMSGYTVEELTGGMDGLLLIAEKSREDVMSKIMSGYEKPYEAVGLRKNGTEYPLRLEARNVRYKGKMVRTVEFRDITEIKQAEQKALERQLFIERIAEQSPDFIYVFDAINKSNIFINKDLRAYLGYQPNQAPEDSYQLIEALIHPDDVAQFKDYGVLIDKWNFEYVKSFEYRLKDAAGNWRYFIGKEKEFQRKEGKIVSLIGVVSDVTEQKKSELEIKISEQKYRMLFENMLNGFILLSLVYDKNKASDLIVTEANKAFENMTGIPADSIIGKKVSGFKQLVQEKTDLKIYYDIAQYGGNFKVIRHVESWDKSFEIYAFRPEQNKLALLITDVTEKEKYINKILTLNEELGALNEEFHSQNEELQQTNIQLDEQQGRLQQLFEEIRISEEQYRNLFDNMLNGFALHEIILNRKGKPVDYRFLQVNKAFEKITGLKSEDILYKTVKEVLPGTEDYWIDTYGKVAITGKPIRYENYAKELNRYYEVVAYCPKKLQFAVVISDITVKKNLELLEENRKDEIQQLAILAEQLIKIQDLDDFYNLLGKTLQNQIGKGYIAITQYQPDEDSMCIKKIYGIGKKLELLAKIIGLNPIGFTIPLSDSVRYLLHNYHSSFYKYEDGIKELFHGVLPESLASPVTKAFDIKEVYGISMLQKNFILGSITIFTTSKTGPLKMELLESLVLLASNAMQRIMYAEGIKEKEQQFRSIFNNSTDAIFILDADGYVLESNDIACSRLEYTKTELVGLKREQFNHPDYKEVFPNAVKLMKKQAMASYETIHITKSGKLIPVEVYVNYIEFKGKRCFMVVARDITERKEIEKRVFNAVIEAEEKERLRFSKDLHDGIGALLSSIKIYINLMESGADEQKRQMLIESTKELIGDAIIAAREISRNIQPSTIRDFGLVSSVQTFIEKINKTGIIKISSRFIHLEARLPINAEVMLYRIITELINNTLKHAGAKEASLLMSKNENLIKMLYSDNGIGIAPESVKQGLGLDNIRARVLSIEGIFKMETDLGKGVKVNIIIDLQKFNVT